jgi:hypothetical protein
MVAVAEVDTNLYLYFIAPGYMLGMPEDFTVAINSGQASVKAGWSCARRPRYGAKLPAYRRFMITVSRSPTTAFHLWTPPSAQVRI